MSAVITDADREAAHGALEMYPLVAGMRQGNYCATDWHCLRCSKVAQAIADAREAGEKAGAERERAACWCRTRLFRVMDAPPGCPQLVPWWFLAPFEPQAQENHGQSLVRLNERGGLDPSEMLAVVEGRKWHRMNDAEAGAQLATNVADAIARRRTP